MKHFVALLLSLTLIYSCSTKECCVPPPAESGNCDGEFTSENIGLQEVLEANNDFAFELFQTSVALEDGNVVQSPASIFSALLMVYHGSDCETKAQISRTLQLGEAESVFSDPSGAYDDYLDHWNDGSDDYDLTMANAFFSDPNRIGIKDAFRNTLAGFYEAEFQELDFSNSSAVESINQWASDNTEGKIEEVLDQINPEDVAFIMNALYFKSGWDNGFAEQATRTGDFHLSGGTTTQVDMMWRDAGTLFNKGERIEIAELPLQNKKYMVSFIQGANENIHIDDIIKSSDFKSDYESAVEACMEGRLMLQLPKFEIKGKQELKTALTEMGMVDAFLDGQADLTPMGTAGGNLFITKALHDTYIKVDEKGVEGAAVTTIGVGATSLPPSITIDRPFVFVIRKANSSLPLFIGKVENPLK